MKVNVSNKRAWVSSHRTVIIYIIAIFIYLILFTLVFIHDKCIKVFIYS